MINENHYHLIEGNQTTYPFENDLKTPLQLTDGGLFLCQGGVADLVLDTKLYRINKQDMIVAFPLTVLQVLQRSADFKGILIGIEKDFFNNVKIQDKSSLFIFIKENPCISVSEREMEKLLKLCNDFIEEKAELNHPFRKVIDETYLTILAYEIAAIYLKRNPVKHQQRSRSDNMFQQFIFSLFNNYRQHRSLEFYAFEQSVTPRHLSLVIKQVSGQTASKWITQCTIMNIKVKLQDRKVSIQEVSDEFNFPNPSFFSQYFKKHTGLSPKDYRLIINQNR